QRLAVPAQDAPGQDEPFGSLRFCETDRRDQRSCKPGDDHLPACQGYHCVSIIPPRNHERKGCPMKLLYFNDFRLGVLKGDNVVDVTPAVQNVPHTGPGTLIIGVIERWSDLRGAL